MQGLTLEPAVAGDAAPGVTCLCSRGTAGAQDQTRSPQSSQSSQRLVSVAACPLFMAEVEVSTCMGGLSRGEAPRLCPWGSDKAHAGPLHSRPQIPLRTVQPGRHTLLYQRILPGPVLSRRTRPWREKAPGLPGKIAQTRGPGEGTCPLLGLTVSGDLCFYEVNSGWTLAGIRYL